jgi:hypothetical protein
MLASMNDLLEALYALRPLSLPLLMPSFAAAGGLAFIAWGGFSIFAESGFSW